MKKITIAGSGVLGSQIAFQTAFHGYSVSVYDIGEAALETARQSLRTLGECYRAEMGASADQVTAALASINLTTDLAAALSDADLLVEAIPENVAIKIEFYERAGPLAPEKTIFATNSSSFLPSQFAAATARPAKFLALHFANEIWIRNTAEIMGHAGTDPQVFDAVVSFAGSIGMVPLPLHKEQPGYITNSLMIPWITAAMRLWAEDVADYKTIDRTWLIGTKSLFVPFAFADMVGLNTAYNITAAMAAQSGDEGLAKIARKLKEEFIDKGKLGANTGEGFYTYPDPEFVRPEFISARA